MVVKCSVIAAAIDPGCDYRQLLSEGNQIGASTRNQDPALTVQTKKSRGRQRSGAERVLQRNLRQPDGIAHR